MGRIKQLRKKLLKEVPSASLDDKEIDKSEVDRFVDFLQENEEAKFYQDCIWKWIEWGQMDEAKMEEHNRIHNNPDCIEYQRHERFHQKTGLGNPYHYEVDVPEVLEEVVENLFIQWVQEKEKGVINDDNGINRQAKTSHSK